MERVKGYENQGLKWLFAFDSCLRLECLNALEKRLKSVPNGWRDARMIEVQLGKLIDRVAETIPIEQRISILRNLRSQEIRIGTSAAASVPDFTLVPLESAYVLTQAAMDNQCLFCSKTVMEARKCELRKALDRFTTLDREEIDGCRYRAGSMDREFLKEA